MSNGVEEPTTLFERERSRLTGIAYRMLGSADDADDVVQEAWLRWRRAEHDRIVNPAAFLTTVTSRLALDRLTSATHRREQYVGPWLPEPVATTDGDPESVALMEESIMLGFLTVLERLGPVERAVFVLREVFDTPYPEVALVVDRSEDNCRQIARRAREHVRASRPRIKPDLERDRELLDAFVEAVASGELAKLEHLLHEDVVLTSDGGPNVRAARHPIVGATRVARFIHGLATNAREEITVDYVSANGQLSLLVGAGPRGESLFTLDPAPPGQLIGRILVHRNPDKLTRIGRAANPDG